MNKKKQKVRNEYKELETKIFLRTAVMVIVAFFLIVEIYIMFMQGHFANTVVGFLEYFIYKDYDKALAVYERVFRGHMDFFIIIAVLAVFLMILRIYLMSFTRYFNEINKGIDALILENAADISLSTELAATEKKINYIKHTLEQRKLAAQVEEQRKNDLVMYLAHDLKTPLTSVIGYLTLLRDESQISEKLREKYLSISLDKAERLEDLINDFFEITRFNLSALTLELSRVNLTRMLEQLVYEFKPMLEEKSLECKLNAPADFMIKIDVEKMQRVLDNLLKNAVNYSFEGEQIEIEAVPSDKEITLTVLNHGNTISKEKLERIFEQFYRLDTARTTKNGGAGLGLAISKEIVELHGGSIRAFSEDEIIRFDVVLPLS